MSHTFVAGKVIIGRTTKPADYESKKAEVELSFALPEGSTEEAANAAVEAVTHVALTHVHRILGLEPAKPATAGKAGKGTKATTTTGGTTVTAGPAEAAAKTAAAAAAAAVVGEEQESSTHLPPTALAAAVAVEDGGLGELLGAAPQPVTDEELIAAITKKNGEIKSPPAIRGLIGKYVAPPKQAKDIPAEVRHKFLEELAALKAV